MSSQFDQYNLGGEPETNDFQLEAPQFTDVFQSIGGNTLVKKGNLQSPNYVPDNQGYTLNNDGSAEFQDVTIVGNLTATTGTIGGFTIGATTLTGSNLILDSSGQRITLGTGNDVVILDADDTTYRLWAGNATAASAPFSVTKAGVLNATGATISGNITATTGTIGGFTIGATTITGTNLTLDSSGQRITLGSSNDVVILDADDATYRLWAGNATAASAPFSVTKAGVLSATGATISGTLTASAGTIGGFSVGSDYIRDAANTFGLASTVTGGDDVRFWAGDTFANRNSAPFKITEAGNVTASSITLTTAGALLEGTVIINAPLTKYFTAGESIAANDALYTYPVATTNTHTIDLERSSSQYLSAADSTSLSITGDMTIELWVYLESAPSSGETYELVNKYDESGNQQSYGLFYNNNGGTPRLVFLASSAGSSNVEMAKNQTISTATWTHVAITYTASTGTTEFFINGSSIGTTSGGPASIFDSTAGLRIGARLVPSIGNYFDGYIDDVRIWNAVRSAANIAFYKNKVLSGSETNLQGYWQLNNALTDATANGNTLTNNGGAVFQSSSLPFTGGTLFKTQANISGAYEGFIGFARAAISAGAAGEVVIAGEVSGMSSLTLGALYYLSNTAGAVSTSAGTNTRKVGIATSSTTLLITNLW